MTTDPTGLHVNRHVGELGTTYVFVQPNFTGISELSTMFSILEVKSINHPLLHTKRSYHRRDNYNEVL